MRHGRSMCPPQPTPQLPRLDNTTALPPAVVTPIVGDRVAPATATAAPATATTAPATTVRAQGLLLARTVVVGAVVAVAGAAVAVALCRGDHGGQKCRCVVVEERELRCRLRGGHGPAMPRHMRTAYPLNTFLVCFTSFWFVLGLVPFSQRYYRLVFFDACFPWASGF